MATLCVVNQIYSTIHMKSVNFRVATIDGESFNSEENMKQNGIEM